MQEQHAAAEQRSPAADDQLYVAGILVHAMPAHAEPLKSWIASQPGAQVHGGAEGKLVVTLEAASTAAILDQLSSLRDQPGVLSALPVYQHNEPAAQIDQEESYGD